MRGKIKKKRRVRRGRRVRHRVVGGGGRGQGALRKISAQKSAHEMKRNSEKGWPGSGVARNLRTTGNHRRRPNRLFFLRPSGYRCLSLFFSYQRCSARAYGARISCDVGSELEAERIRASERTSSGFKRRRVHFSGYWQYFTRRPRRTDCANRHKYSLRVIERESVRRST